MNTSAHCLHSKTDNQTEPMKHKSGYELKKMAAISAAIILYYLFCITALAWIGFVLIFYFVGGFAAAHVVHGLLPAMNALEGLARTILKSFRQSNSQDWSIKLQENEAPKLYAMVNRVAVRLGVKPPKDIFLEMSADTYIKLSGYHTGRGGSKLCIGYDLLAILTKSELEPILAHQLAHAKLIIRAYDAWCNTGLMHAYELNKNLAKFVAEHEMNSKKFYTASIIYRYSKMLTNYICRTYADFSRPQELAADYLAAECYGSDIFISALIKSEIATYKRQSINWRDRKIYAQWGESFSKWLYNKLTPANETELKQIESYIFQPEYNTEHSIYPHINDRIASLPLNTKQIVSNEPAIQLLSQADKVAANYIQHMDKIISSEEQKDTLTLKNIAHEKIKSAASGIVYSSEQKFAIVTIVIDMLISIAGIVLYFYKPLAFPIMMITGCTFLGIGAVVFVKFTKREAYSLPSPTYQIWNERLVSSLREVPIVEWEGDVESKVLSLLPKNTRRKSALAVFWAEVCYNMLGKCDYRSALIASEQCLAADQYRLEGLLTNAISLAWLNHSKNITNIDTAINKAYNANRFSKSMSWGIGWAFLLCRDWYNAEIYLLKAVELYPGDATILAALSICQRQRGKIYEAVDTARKTIATSGTSIELRKNLVDTLLDAGKLNEALRELEVLDRMTNSNFDILLQIVYYSCLCGDINKSKATAAKLEELFPNGMTYIKLAQVFEDTEQKEISQQYYKTALTFGSYP